MCWPLPPSARRHGCRRLLVVSSLGQPRAPRPLSPHQGRDGAGLAGPDMAATRHTAPRHAAARPSRAFAPLRAASSSGIPGLLLHPTSIPTAPTCWTSNSSPPGQTCPSWWSRHTPPESQWCVPATILPRPRAELVSRMVQMQQAGADLPKLAVMPGAAAMCWSCWPPPLRWQTITRKHRSLP